MIGPIGLVSLLHDHSGSGRLLTCPLKIKDNDDDINDADNNDNNNGNNNINNTDIKRGSTWTGAAADASGDDAGVEAAVIRRRGLSRGCPHRTQTKAHLQASP